MKIRTFTPSIYQGCHFYIRNLGDNFEYLASVKGEIYGASIRITPRLWLKLATLLGLRKSPYTQRDDSAAVAYLSKMAEATIETILNPKKSTNIADKLCQQISSDASRKAAASEPSA